MFVGEGQHLVVDTRWVADAQHADAAIHKFLRNPIHRRVTLRAHQHLRLAMQRFVDGFDQCGGLACAGRAVDDGHVACTQHLVDGRLLRGVQPGEADGIEFSEAGFQGAQQCIAQFGQAIAFGAEHVGQCFEHRAVAGLVEVELHTQPVGRLNIYNSPSARHYYHHAGLVGITDASLEVVVVEASVCCLSEEADGASILEVVFDVGIFGAGHLQHQLVQRVVVTASGGDGEPAHAALHLACHAHGFRLPAELFLLVFVLHAQQQLLLLEVQAGAVCLFFLFHGSKGRHSCRKNFVTVE